MADALFELRRSGGYEPSDDESLTVFDDGRFTMWRTVGWRRVGAFAGQLSPQDFDAVRAGVRAAPQGDEQGDVPRGAAVEEHDARGARLVIGGSSDAPAAWAPLVSTARRLVDELTVSPVAALELDIVSALEASLAVVGDAPIGVVAGSLRFRIERLTADGVPVASWYPSGAEGSGPPELLSSQDVRAQDPGPWRTLLLGHGWQLEPGELLRVWATVGITPASPAAVGVHPPAPKMARLVAVFPDAA